MIIAFKKFDRPILYECVNNAIIEALAAYSAIYEMPIQLQNLGEIIIENKYNGYGIKLTFPDWFPKNEIEIILNFIKSFNGEVISDEFTVVSINNKYNKH